MEHKKQQKSQKRKNKKKHTAKESEEKAEEVDFAGYYKEAITELDKAKEGKEVDFER